MKRRAKHLRFTVEVENDLLTYEANSERYLPSKLITSTLRIIIHFKPG